jgi:hypothetical protein
VCVCVCVYVCVCVCVFVILGEYIQVFSMCPILGEELIGFRLVSTLLHDTGATAAAAPASSSAASNNNKTKPVPGLLILTENVRDEDEEDEGGAGGGDPAGKRTTKHLKVELTDLLVRSRASFALGRPTTD